MRTAILFARYAVRAVLYRLRANRHRQAAGLEELFAGPEPECPIPLPDCRTCRPDPLTIVSSLDPGEVGRQASRGAAILDAAAWLEASGWANDDRGEVQCYAAWLLKVRAAYERGAEVPS